MRGGINSDAFFLENSQRKKRHRKPFRLAIHSINRPTQLKYTVDAKLFLT